MVSKLKQTELSEAIHSTPGFRQTAYMADCIAERIIELGWVPIEDFPDEEYPAPTQAVVNDVMERIISGLPRQVLVPANPDGPAIYKKQRLDIFLPDGEPTPSVNEAHTWVRIPDFDNYEINKLGDIRSRWTKRKLDVSVDGDAEYVDMHDKEGFGHLINVGYIMEKVFES